MTRLSDIQAAVLQELAQGHNQAQISTHMDTNTHTTKSRIALIGGKLQTKGAAHSVAMGYVRGYLQAPTEGEPDPKLPTIQVQILNLVARGKAISDIGETLGLTGDQVKYRLKKMYRTLGAKNDCHAVSLGFQTRNLVIKSSNTGADHTSPQTAPEGKLLPPPGRTS